MGVDGGSLETGRDDSRHASLVYRSGPTEHPNRYGYAFTAAVVTAFLEGAYLDAHGQLRPPPDPPTCSVVLCGS
jgi:hypothetical protein